MMISLGISRAMLGFVAESVKYKRELQNTNQFALWQVAGSSSVRYLLQTYIRISHRARNSTKPPRFLL